MGKLSSFARKAVGWLKKAVGTYQENRQQVKAAAAIVKDLGIASDQLEKFSKALVKVEETVGAHTHAWGEISRAAKAKQAPNLTTADAKYLFEFKKIFDRHIKKRFV